MKSVLLSIVGAAFLGLAACGGSETPPTTPSPDPAATPGASSAPATADMPTTPDAPTASDTKPSDTKPPAADKRLEDEKMTKTTSAGGSYAVNVVAASGISADDVVVSIGKLRDDNDKCYAKLFKGQLAAKGKTTYEITISAKGKTSAVKLKGDELKSGDVTKCLEKLIKAVAWEKVTDKGGGKTTVDWAVAGN